MSFLPQDYKVPTSSKYMKFKEGENTFRVLSDAIMGYEYWNTDDKPVRSQSFPESTPNIRPAKFGESVKHFWAFKVWNYAEKKIQILQLVQTSIMEGMKKYIDNPKWGDPQGYDFIVEKKDDGGFIKYSVGVNPKEPISSEVKDQAENVYVNLTALFAGADPFSKDSPQVPYVNENYPKEEIKPEDIPF